MNTRVDINITCETKELRYIASDERIRTQVLGLLREITDDHAAGHAELYVYIWTPRGQDK